MTFLLFPLLKSIAHSFKMQDSITTYNAGSYYERERNMNKRFLRIKEKYGNFISGKKRQTESRGFAHT